MRGDRPQFVPIGPSLPSPQRVVSPAGVCRGEKVAGVAAGDGRGRSPFSHTTDVEGAEGHPSWLLLCTEIIQPAEAAVQIAHIRDTLIEKIAYVRNKQQSVVSAEVADKGDLKIDSKVGQAVVGYLEVALDREGLVRVEDQTRKNLTSLNGLEAMIERRLTETEGESDG
jgi:hypothetical protein